MCSALVQYNGHCDHDRHWYTMVLWLTRGASCVTNQSSVGCGEPYSEGGCDAFRASARVGPAPRPLNYVAGHPGGGAGEASCAGCARYLDSTTPALESTPGFKV